MRAPLRALLALVLIGLALAPGRAHAQVEPDRGVVMAVRADAPPFAWRDPETGILRGFLYDLCVAAVVRTDFFIASTRAVLPEARDAFFEGRDASVDLLCDPTTISLARLRAFAARGLEFSPIVFVANGSDVANPDRAAGARADLLDDAACLRAPGAAEPAEAAAPQRVAAGFVRGTTGEATLRAAIRDGALRLAPGEVVCPVVMESHWDAARAFCDGALGYYFGDEDILRSALALARADDAGCALAAAAPNPLSYEPYAFVSGSPSKSRSTRCSSPARPSMSSPSISPAARCRPSFSRCSASTASRRARPVRSRLRPHPRGRRLRNPRINEDEHV